MPLYNVELAKAAAKELAKIPKNDQKSIVKALDALKSTPRPPGAEKLQVNPTFHRVRCGNYRLIYAIDDKHRLCIVVVIRDRKDAFKGLGSLDAKLAVTFAAVADKLLESSAVAGSA